MDFLKRNIQKTLRNGNQIVTKLVSTSAGVGTSSTLSGNYLPATSNEDGTYTVDLTKVTFNGHIVATGEVSAYGAGSGTTPSGGSVTIIDNLTSTDANAALSANQGRELKDLIDNIDISGIDLSGYYSKTDIDTLLAAKANSTDLTSHSGNTTVHITSAERTKWNNAATNSHTHTNKTVLDNLTQTVIDNSHTHSNKTVLDGITSTKVSNWDSAATNKHTHSNKTVLDGITSTKVSNWDTVVTNWNTAFYFDNSGNLKAKVNVIGEKEISAYGAGESSGGSGIVTIVDNLNSTSTDSALSANMGRYLKSLIDNIDISELDLSGFYTKTEVDTLLNGKAASSHTHTFNQISDRTTYIYDASASRTANYVLAAPNGSNGKATFRKLVAADIPSLAISKITNLQTTLDAKATASDLTTHSGNTTVHITATERTNWNAAYSDKHTHSNKSVLDGITAAKVTAWDGVVTNWNKAFTIDSNNNLKVKLNLIGEQEVSAYGAGSSSGGGAITIIDALTSSAKDAALSANQGRVLKSLIDNIDISSLDTSNFVTLNTAQTISATKTFTGNIVMGTSHYIYGVNETNGGMLFFDGNRTVIGSIGATSTLATHLRSKTGHLTVGTGNTASYNVIDSGNLDTQLIAKLATGTSTALTDETEIITSYAGTGGFDSTAGASKLYRRDSTTIWNYIKSKASNYYPSIYNYSGTAIAANTDLESILSAGTYYCSGGDTTATLTNCPISSGNFKMWHIANTGTYGEANQWFAHLLLAPNTPRLYLKGHTNNGFTAWRTIAFTTDNVASATKATQDGDGNTISSTYLKLSGGTMTGKLKWSDSSLSSSTSTNYVLCIDSFANGGETHYITTANLSVGSATNADQLQRHLHTRLSTSGHWYKVFTMTIAARYAYGGGNFMITDFAKPTSSESYHAHVILQAQQQNAFGSAPLVNLYIMDGNLSTEYLKGVYTLNSDSTTIDVYLYAPYTYMRPIVSNITTYVSNGSWSYPTEYVSTAPTFNVSSKYANSLLNENFNRIVYNKYNYFRNNANDDNAGYVGVGSTTTNDIFIKAYSGNNLILGANGSSVVTLDGSTVTSSNDIYVSKTSGKSLFNATNGNGSIELLTDTNRGIYDRTTSTWLIATNGTNSWLSRGNVGINTTSPSYRLHVNGSLGCTTLYHTNNVYQYWKDSEGADISIHSLSSANNFWLGYGLCPKGYQLRIGGGSIQFYSGTDRTSRMFLSSAGNFGIGTTSPSQKLHVSGNILATGEVTAYSDIRLKKNIKPLQVRGELKPVTYEKDGKKGIGFIAQDVKKIYPELVTEEKTDEKYLSLNYAQLTAVLYAEILELKAEIRELKDKMK